ncbi:hypothetical protein B0H14DRAFT_3437796 [Mycena olivaceomarginata]|nr:hypothetical protein B0H14DRAFT_3437796 [Mycena olivaceomarginata]
MQDLYFAVEGALTEQSLIGGIQWSRRGNLILHPPSSGTARSLVLQRKRIWAAIHPLQGLPKDYTCPPFETNDSWYSVVLHGVPAPTINDEPTVLRPDEVQSWLALNSGLRGEVKATSVLCSPADLKTKQRVAVRVSLSLSEDAFLLFISTPPSPPIDHSAFVLDYLAARVSVDSTNIYGQRDQGKHVWAESTA